MQVHQKNYTSISRIGTSLQAHRVRWVALGLLLPVMSILSACVLRPTTVQESPEKTHLVAAGVLKGDMVSRAKVVGDLRIIQVASGKMTIAFDGYRMPAKGVSAPYLVKAVPGKFGNMIVPAVAVDSYTAEGVVLKVTDPEGKMPLPLKYLVEYDFAIEVSEVSPR